jgi:hypothetical protein
MISKRSKPKLTDTDQCLVMVLYAQSIADVVEVFDVAWKLLSQMLPASKWCETLVSFADAKSLTAEGEPAPVESDLFKSRTASVLERVRAAARGKVVNDIVCSTAGSVGDPVPGISLRVMGQEDHSVDTPHGPRVVMSIDEALVRKFGSARAGKVLETIACKVAALAAIEYGFADFEPRYYSMGGIGYTDLAISPLSREFLLRDKRWSIVCRKRGERIARSVHWMIIFGTRMAAKLAKADVPARFTAWRFVNQIGRHVQHKGSVATLRDGAVILQMASNPMDCAEMFSDGTMLSSPHSCLMELYMWTFLELEACDLVM